MTGKTIICLGKFQNCHIVVSVQTYQNVRWPIDASFMINALSDAIFRVKISVTIQNHVRELEYSSRPKIFQDKQSYPNFTYRFRPADKFLGVIFEFVVILIFLISKVFTIKIKPPIRKNNYTEIATPIKA